MEIVRIKKKMAGPTEKKRKRKEKKREEKENDTKRGCR